MSSIPKLINESYDKDGAELKPWQKGYALDDLKDIEAFYERYNRFAQGEFAKFKKHTIAAELDKCRLVQKVHSTGTPTLIFQRSIVKAAGNINMFPGVPIGRKAIGDCVIQRMAWGPTFQDRVAKELEASASRTTTWFFCFAEDEESCAQARIAGYQQVGSKVTSMADIIAVWVCFNDGKGKLDFDNDGTLSEQTRPDPVEWITAAPVGPQNYWGQTVSDLLAVLDQCPTKFEDHYSNYNEKHTWSALSLRGYSPEADFICKPVEMNKKWKEANPGPFELQWTRLQVERFPGVRRFLAEMFPAKLHRVRFMRLVGSSTLGRHTDLVDPDLGVADGKLMRFHLPLRTSQNVSFCVWSMAGIKQSFQMPVGEWWYVDIRKPHCVENLDDEDRIHLVVDVEANEDIRQLIRRS